MDRRSALKSLIVGGALLSVPAAAAATPGKLSTRKVFKIVKGEFPHIKVSPEWTTDQIDELRRQVEAARKDPIAAVLTTSDVQISTMSQYMMVKCDFADLRKGDVFVLYEGTGERVEDKSEEGTCFAWTCTSDAYVNEGVETVVADHIFKPEFTVPVRSPV